MNVRRRVVFRVTGLLTRWGVVKHPYGRDYAEKRYSLTGRRREALPMDGEDTSSTTFAQPRAVLALMVMLTLGLLATGLLML